MNYLQIGPHYLKSTRIAKLEYYTTFFGNFTLKIHYIKPHLKYQSDSPFSKNI